LVVLERRNKCREGAFKHKGLFLWDEAWGGKCARNEVDKDGDRAFADAVRAL
jgi:hypothetical protein